MLYAVTIEPLNATFFLSQQPDDNEWQVQEGVELEIPFNYDTWSDGAEPPDQTLCVSITDPKHYKMFKYKRNVDPAQFKPAGRHFGGVYFESYVVAVYGQPARCTCGLKRTRQRAAWGHGRSRRPHQADDRCERQATVACDGCLDDLGGVNGRR